MSYILRCMDGGCSWGMTLESFDDTCKAAEQHQIDSRHENLVSLDNEWYNLTLHDREGHHNMTYDYHDRRESSK